MITGVRDIYYNVSDMGRAVEFYSKAFGMTKTFGDDHWTSMSCNGFLIGLHALDESGEVPATPRDSHGQHCGGTLTLASDDVTSDRVKLEELGAKILGEDDAPWGHMLIFEDLDGNVLKLMKPKY